MPRMTSERAAAFDQAFAPEPLPDRKIGALDAMFSTVTSSGHIVRLMAEGLAKVNGRTVTDYDCWFCGDVGRHIGEFCPHQEAMFEAVDELEYQEHAEEQAGARAVAVGVG